MARDERTHPAPHGAALLAALTAVTAAILVFVPALDNGFVQWDDDRNFLTNSFYRGLGWAQLHWALTTTLSGHWIPVTWLTLSADYALWGMRPFGYHLTNVILHAVNAGLFCLVATRLLCRVAGEREAVLGATIAALVFAVHPLRVESVAWITERRDVLSGFFYLLTVLAYLRAAEPGEPRRWRWLGASLGCYALGLLSKSMLMSLPIVLLVLDVYPLRRLPGDPCRWGAAGARAILIEKLPYAAMAVTIAYVAATAVSRSLGFTPFDAYPVSARLGMATYSLLFYARKTFMPLDLSPMYELPAHVRLVDPPFLGVLAVSVLLTAALVAVRRRWPAVLAAWTVYAVTVAPVSGFLHNGTQIVADRYSYLPGLTWALLIGGTIARLVAAGRRPALRTMLLGATAAWIIGLGALTWQQGQVWADTETLWQHALNVDPECAFCHRQLGALLGNRGDLVGAIAHFKRAVELRPDRVHGNGNVGLALLKAGRPAEAAPYFERILRAYPNDADTRVRLGTALLAQGRPADAVMHLELVVREHRQHAEALVNLGVALTDSGRPADGLVYLERAAALGPPTPLLHLGLARAFAAVGRPGDAEQQLALLRGMDAGRAAQIDKRR